MRRISLLCLGLVAALGIGYALRTLAPAPFVAPPIVLARAHWQSGDAATAREIAVEAMPGLRSAVAARPEDVHRHMALAEALALSGRSAEALAEADRAVSADLAPWAVSPPGRADGGSLLEAFAVVATEAGAPDRALAALDRLLARGDRITADELRADPRFRPLRPDARFARVLASHGWTGDAPR